MPILKRLWQNSPSLTLLGVLMFVTLVGNLIGLALDPRIITGAPAWLKPTKFSLSTAIFGFTVAWVFGYLTRWPRLVRISGRVMALALAVEIAVIDIQAARGVASHFNTGMPVDAAMYATMGISIAILWLAMAIVTVALFRQPFADRGFGWSLRLGMAISLVGASLGGLMTRPTAAQLEDARNTRVLRVAGAHTVGAPDGGPGLLATAWSTEHGDLRIPHFFGLHALQLVPLLALPFRRRPALAILCGVSYLAFLVLLVWQALRGQSIVHPDQLTLVAWTSWGAATALAAVCLANLQAQPDTSVRRFA